MKFQFQKAIYAEYHLFYADFVVDGIYVIEVDGGYHNDSDQYAKDYVRTGLLESMGYKVLRINNSQCTCSATILKVIFSQCEALKKKYEKTA